MCSDKTLITSRIKIRLGDLRTIRHSESIHPHNDYDPKTVKNDIALIKLSTKTPCNDKKIRSIHIAGGMKGIYIYHQVPSR